jgi:hypothetical protein
MSMAIYYNLIGLDQVCVTIFHEREARRHLSLDISRNKYSWWLVNIPKPLVKLYIGCSIMTTLNSPLLRPPSS